MKRMYTLYHHIQTGHGIYEITPVMYITVNGKLKKYY